MKVNEVGVMKRNPIILAVLILSILTLGITIGDRVKVESSNKSVDIALDYGEFADMAEQSDKELSWWFKKFANLGIGHVGLQEESLESLLLEHNELKSYMGWEFLQEVSLNPNEFSDVLNNIKYENINEHDVVIRTRKKELFDFIYRGLRSRYNKGYEILSQNEDYIILLKGELEDVLYEQDTKLVNYENKLSGFRKKPVSSKIMNIGLGFDENKIALIKESGLKVLPRPYTNPKWYSEKYIKAVFEDFKTYDMVPDVLISGRPEVLGYPENIDLIKEYMLENDIKAAMIESSVQRGHLEEEGLDLLVRSLDYNAVRTFSVWPYIQERYKYYNYEGPEEIENSLYRAVTERNIRFIYFKPIKLDETNIRHYKFLYLTEFEEYEKLFNRFEKRLSNHGITIGPSSTMKSHRVRIAKQSLMSMGIVAAGIILLDSFIKINKKQKYILLILGTGLITAGFVIRPMIMDKILALGASIVFPSLAMVYFCKLCFKYIHKDEDEEKLYMKILYSIKDLLIISVISLLGGLFVAAILSHIEYLLEMDIFRGVKIAQLIPIIIYMASYMAYFGYKRDKDDVKEPGLRLSDIKRLLLEDIKIVYIIISVIILGIGYVYIARTGHETKIQPSVTELILRNILEENMLARPRTKEFLIAFPALMISIYLAKSKLRHFIFFGGLATVIGQTSIVNTFSHIRTPIYISVVRTMYSLLFGIILGIIYILVLELLIKVYRRLKDKYYKYI